MTTSAAVYLLERGRPLSDTPGWALRLSDLPELRGLASPSAARAAVHTAPGGHRVVLGIRGATNEGEWAAVLELDVGADGIERVATSTTFAGQLEDVVMLSADEPFALMSRRPTPTTRDRGSWILGRTTPGGRWARRLLSPDERARLFHVSGYGADPHLIGFEDGTVRAGDLRRWDGTFVGQPAFFGGGRPISGIASEPTPAGVRRWTSSAAGALAKLEPAESQWQLVTNQLPPLMHRCSNVYDDCGRLLNNAPIMDLAFSPALGELLINLETCDTRLARRTRDGCVRALPSAPGAALNVEVPRPFWVDELGVVVVTGGGGLREWRHE